MAAPSHSRILILDFGAQYTQLIARRVRETHVYCEIHPYDVGDEFVRAFAPRGRHPLRRPDISVTEGDTPRAPRGGLRRWACRCSGICYGMQTMAAQLGGAVEIGPGARVRLRRGPRARPLDAVARASRTAATPRATACSTSG